LTKEFLLHKDNKKRKPTAHSGTFGCPTARVTASQPKEPSIFQRTIAKIENFTIFDDSVKTIMSK
jgi:hypothetical protein